MKKYWNKFKLLIKFNFYKQIKVKLNNYFKNKFKNYQWQKIKQRTLQMAGNSGYKKFLNMIWRTFFLTVMVIVIAFPFYWMIITSFKTDEELDPTKVQTLFPNNWTFKNYDFLLNSQDLKVGRYLFNSFLVAFLSTSLKLIISAIAGFGLAYYNSRFREFIFVLMLATMMVPGEAIIMGQYIFVLQVNWDESLPALVVPFIASVFTIYMIRQAFEQIPKSVHNAAKIDGASNIKFFFRIALPLIKPILWTAAIISFIASWNSVLWPTIVLESDSKWVTIPMLLWQLTKISGNDNLNVTSLMDPQNLKMAGAVITIFPMFILYLFAKKWIIKGITKESGTKG